MDAATECANVESRRFTPQFDQREPGLVIGYQGETECDSKCKSTSMKQANGTDGRTLTTTDPTGGMQTAPRKSPGNMDGKPASSALRPDWQTEDGSVQMYLADAREVLPTLAAASIDCIVCDPPYGHNNNNGDLIHRREAALGRPPSGENPPQARPIANDGAEANDLLRDVLPQFKRVLKPGSCCCCCCGGGGPDPQFARWSLWIDEHLDFKQMVVWDKGPMGMGWHYRRSYETVLVAQKPGAACKWHAETDDIENIIRPGYRGIRKIIPQADDHPTPKPVELAAHFIKLHSQPGDSVLDPFMGRGWVAQACVRTGRRFIGVEIDRGHFWPGVERLEGELSRHPLIDTPQAVQRSLLGDDAA